MIQSGLEIISSAFAVSDTVIDILESFSLV
jgi:hypothetical protein